MILIFPRLARSQIAHNSEMVGRSMLGSSYWAMLAWTVCAVWPLLVEGAVTRTQSVEQRIFQSINQVRRENRLPPLKWSAKIAEQARSHSSRMLTRRFFSHEDPSYGDPGRRLRRAGILWRLCGENIFEERGETDPVRSAVSGWMHSSGHRRNILTPGFTYTGVGVAVGRDGTYTITQMFAAF